MPLFVCLGCCCVRVAGVGVQGDAVAGDAVGGFKCQFEVENLLFCSPGDVPHAFAAATCFFLLQENASIAVAGKDGVLIDECDLGG